MDKKIILAAAREDKYRGQEYERNESIRSNLLSSAITLIVGVILFLLELFVLKRWNLSLIIVILSFAGVDSLYEGIKFKRYHMTAIGVIQFVGAVFVALIFAFQVLAA